MKKRKRSFGEYYIEQYLKENNIDYIKEKTFSECRSSKNYPLRFDFYLPDYNILIEFQGQHHYEPINKYNRAKRIHKKTIIHDDIKRKYCCDNNIELFEIAYKEKNNISQILNELLQNRNSL